MKYLSKKEKLLSEDFIFEYDAYKKLKEHLVKMEFNKGKLVDVIYYFNLNHETLAWLLKRNNILDFITLPYSYNDENYSECFKNSYDEDSPMGAKMHFVGWDDPKYSHIPIHHSLCMDDLSFYNNEKTIFSSDTHDGVFSIDEKIFEEFKAYLESVKLIKY